MGEKIKVTTLMNEKHGCFCFGFGENMKEKKIGCGLGDLYMDVYLKNYAQNADIFILCICNTHIYIYCISIRIDACIYIHK